jgi:hypothetical protein
MFGFTALFAAVGRLTASINRMADMFDRGNEALEGQLTVHPAPAAPDRLLPPAASPGDEESADPDDAPVNSTPARVKSARNGSKRV